MSRIRMVMFDLAGTTIVDDSYVARCLHRAACDVGIESSEEFIGSHIGTNKRDLYKLLIARARGAIVSFEHLGSIQVTIPESQLAEKAFELYEQYMLDHYRTEIREMPGAVNTFRWLHDHNILIATDTGFHKRINETIMNTMGWLRDGLVDVAIDLQDIPDERGRPAPYMIFEAMQRLGIVAVNDVVKVGDQPADLLEGTNAGCRGVIGVLSGPLDAVALGAVRHTHLIPSVAELPQLIVSEGWL